MTAPAEASRMALDHAVVVARRLDDLAGRFEAYGFTLTPRAQHPWGTANRLAQFEGANFVELLEIDRPELIGAAPPSTDGRVFSFGGHVRQFLERDEGMCMLALKGEDSRADVARWRAAGLDTFEPFDFERQARLPDGTTVTVAFSLAYATHPALPGLALFTCHNRFPQHFWKPAYQQHANGVRSIAEVVLSVPDPSAVADFLEGFLGRRPRAVAGGLEAECGPGRIRVIRCDAADREYGAAGDAAGRTGFRALVFECRPGSPQRGRRETAGSLVLDWR